MPHVTIKISSDVSSDVATTVAKGLIALMRTFNAKPLFFLTNAPASGDEHEALWQKSTYDDTAMARMSAQSKLMAAISSIASNAKTAIRIVVVKG